MTSLDTLTSLNVNPTVLSDETISILNDHESIKSYQSTDSSSSSSRNSVSSKDRDSTRSLEYIPPLTEEQANLPDVTLRGLILGLLIGSLMVFTNTYFGLQTGWLSMMSLQTSLVGFGLGKLLAWSRTKQQRFTVDGESGKRPVYRWYDLFIPFGIKENVLVQTTAVATATMPLAGGYISIIPALQLLNPEDLPKRTKLTFSTQDLIIWGLGLAFFGVFLAIPLRKQVILKEKLKFPSGTATAQMIQLLHKDPKKEEYEPVQNPNLDEGSLDIEYDDQPPMRKEGFNHEVAIQWRALGSTFAVSSLITILADIYPSLNTIPAFDWLIPNASYWDWYLSPSVSYIGQGIIMGLPTCLPMALGAFVGWGILSPLSSYMGWAPGPVNDWKTGPRGWILWVSLAIMISESIISLSVICFKEFKAQYERWQRNEVDTGSDPDEILPPWALYLGFAFSSLACVAAIGTIFDDVPVISTVIALIIGALLSVLAVRALGETDLNPVSGIGKVSQIVFALVLPGNLVGNIVAGGVAEAGAMQAGDMMQDLKTGHLAHASPRAQFLGLIIGSFTSVFVSVFAYEVFTSYYTIPSPQFPVPTAEIWLDMARLVNGQPLPPYTATFSLIFALIFAAIPIWKFRYPDHAMTPYLPSGIAFAIGIYNAPNFTLPRLFGALVAEAYLTGAFTRYFLNPVRALVQRYRPSPHEIRVYDAHTRTYLSNPDSPPLPREEGSTFSEHFHKVLFTVIASGLVLGEGTTAIVLLLVKVWLK